jgi:hypothetical protein
MVVASGVDTGDFSGVESGAGLSVRAGNGPEVSSWHPVHNINVIQMPVRITWFIFFI